MGLWSSLVDRILGRPWWYRAMRGVGRSSIAGFPPTATGRVSGRVTGKARREDELVTAPLSNLACVWLELVLEELSDRDWIAIAREVRSIPFVLTDDTGRAIVEISSACDVAVVPEVTSKSGIESPNERERTMLAMLGVPNPGRLHSGFRYRERAIPVNTQLAVAGTGRHRPDVDAVATEGYREDVATVLELRGSSEHPLRITNLPEMIGS